MIKVLTVFGTRPEAIKLAPVVKALQERPESFTPVVCVSAQHREMLDQVLRLFEIQPRYDLNLMTPGQSLSDVTSGVLQRMGEVLAAEKPDLVLVQGDTTTTFAGCLAAFYQRIKVGHVEAGLRTGDKYQPFPEEINRRLTDVLADYHYAPTERARQNLLREGIDDTGIMVTGNTGVDALFMALARLREARGQEAWGSTLCRDLDGRKLILVTAHRRESFGPAFEEICRAVLQIVNSNPDVVVVFPVHPNPNVREIAHRLLARQERLKLVEPLDYAPFVDLLEKSYLVLTDSGGVQEEAPYLGKPVLVLRNVTEREEAVEAGTARVVGTRAPQIIAAVQRLLDDASAYAAQRQVNSPFGDGKASERIVSHLLRRFSEAGSG